MRPVILDLDMTLDGALSLVMAAGAAEVDLMGVSVVAGRAPLDVGTERALQVLQLLGRPDVPVCVGADHATVGLQVDDAEVEPEMGAAWLPEAEALPSGDAVDLLIHGIEARRGEVTVVATGPVTNLAAAEKRRAGILERARRLFVVGGARPGSRSVAPLWADPLAAASLLRCEANLTVLHPAAIEQVLLAPEWAASLAAETGDPPARLLRAAAGARAGVALPACLGVAMVIDPGICRVATREIEVPPDVAAELGSRSRQEAQRAECAVAAESGRFLALLRRLMLDAGDRGPQRSAVGKG